MIPYGFSTGFLIIPPASDSIISALRYNLSTGGRIKFSGTFVSYYMTCASVALGFSFYRDIASLLSHLALAFNTLE
jgi:hypothetical protein